MRTILSITLALWVVAVRPAALAEDNFPKPRIPEELKVFDFLLGEWNSHVEFYDREGKVRRTMDGRQVTVPIVEGVVYKTRSSPPDDSAHFGESWFLYDHRADKYHIATVDLQGNFDVFAGVISPDRLVFTNQPKPWNNGREIIWRRTYYNIQDDAHEVTMEYSFDGGDTWITSNHWLVTRLDGLKAE